ncbi:hypothetical protein PG993_011642 [Apiospora rasikravindrae]|uniref:Heterokaryon incompatibility domain-containing protein n=1 Tax=Apiospora rasikravindrae TaxID=990691 RepID=A0ABR1S072_9PEZI
MGNAISSTPSFRSCGLCYFKLPAGTPFLDQPAVSRRGIELIGLPDYGWKAGRLDDVLLPWKNIDYIEMEAERDALRKSSGRGCAGCAAILRCLDAQLRDRGFTLDDLCWQDRCTLLWLVGDRKPYNPSLLIRFGVAATKDRTEELGEAEFSVRIEYTGDKYFHPAARKVSPSAVALGYTGSLTSLEVIKTWLNNCEMAHEDCRQPVGVLPYRVVELSRDTNGQAAFRLVQGLGGREPYACLSHRWGPSTERCRTTSLTLASYLERVPPDILPKTFREAGEVAMHLGLKYLWIDSLCIIQDDEEDWKAQAAEMCNIYQGSYVTIAATSASQDDDGMFHTVPKFPPRPRRVRQARPRHPQAHYPLPPVPGPGPPLRTGRLPAPRARLGLPRAVAVAAHRALRPRRSGVGVRRRQRRLRVRHGGRPVPVAPEASLQDQSGRAGHVLHERGLASNGQRVLDHAPHLRLGQPPGYCRHRETVWDEAPGLPRPLLGGPLGEESGAGPAVVRAARGKVDAAARGQPGPFVVVGVRHGRIAAAGIPAVDHGRRPLEVLSFRVDLAGPDEFGPIKHAEITVRGLLAQGSWTTVPGSLRGHRFAQYHPSSSTRSSSGPGGGYSMDADYNFSDAAGSRRLEEGCPVFCLKTGFVFYQHHVCLILRPLNEERTVFERIGLLQTAHKEVVDSCQKA